MSYQVIDIQTKQPVGKPMSKQAARAKRNRLDLAYGAVRYVVREVAA
ncbi:hypothetical protein ABIC89_001027 [Variovorax boronicumulans]